MFSDDVLEKIYARKELRNVDLATQVLVVRTIEEVLTEVNGNANEFQSNKSDEYSNILIAG